MRTQAEGIRRLSIFCGVIAALAWVTFVFVNVGLSQFQPGDWPPFLAGVLVCFLAGLSLVRGVDWVRQGFRSDR